MNWQNIPHRKRKVMERKLTPRQKGLWTEGTTPKIVRLRPLFGGMRGAGPSKGFHHYGIYCGPPEVIAARRARVQAIGTDKVVVSPIRNGHFLALWKIPEGERLLSP